MSNIAGVLERELGAEAVIGPGHEQLDDYGRDESPLPEFQPKFERALTWKTRVLLVRDFGKGRGISYGSTFITPRPMRVATLATGYADGYPRHASGHHAAVIIGGKRCRILGRVTMDQIMVDVTGVNAAPGDEVLLLGQHGNEQISATELASRANTIPWDIFTGIGARVARLHRNGDASASKAPIPA